MAFSRDQFVHRVIDGVCDKQGPRYETFAKTMSLADYSRLVRCVETTVKAVGREEDSKQQVSKCSVYSEPGSRCIVMCVATTNVKDIALDKHSLWLLK